ncbi:hypothetical protein ADK54_07795 [Streptomyces sp. WM6378]|nr:hypothetical protein ADK54_07795 [Streptomyces sp. WM6378]
MKVQIACVRYEPEAAGGEDEGEGCGRRASIPCRDWKSQSTRQASARLTCPKSRAWKTGSSQSAAAVAAST